VVGVGEEAAAERRVELGVLADELRPEPLHPPPPPPTPSSPTTWRRRAGSSCCSPPHPPPPLLAVAEMAFSLTSYSLILYLIVISN
jgi:hypothetical protein